MLAVLRSKWIYAAFVPLLWGERGRSTTAPSQTRRYISLTVRVDTLRDGARDDTLARPLLLTADGTRVYYYDYSDGRVSAIDSSGRLLWRAGRRNSDFAPGRVARIRFLRGLRPAGHAVVSTRPAD